MIAKRRVALGALIATTARIAIDVASSRNESFRDFDGATMGQLDADMWRSHYERRPVALFRQLASAHREQFHTGFFRSFPVALRAGRAAFTFKDGRTREEYARALPDLEKYFASLNSIAREPFDVKQAAHDELEWWIIRREPKQRPTMMITDTRKKSSKMRSRSVRVLACQYHWRNRKQERALP